MKFSFDKTLLQLKESITFSIADADDTVKDILELSFAQRKPFWDFLQKNLSHAELYYFAHNRVSDVLVPDGSDYDEKEGIMSFYTKGLPDHIIVKCVSFLIWKIKEDHGEVLHTEANLSRMYKDTLTYRFNVKIDVPDDLAPEMNLSNANANALLSSLNYEPDYSGSISINELLMKIGMMEDNDIHLNSHTRKEEGKGNHVFFGLDVEQLKERLATLKKMCEWGIEHNFNYISYG